MQGRADASHRGRDNATDINVRAKDYQRQMSALAENTMLHSDGNDEPSTEDVRIAWWNTHLQPPHGKPLAGTDRTLAFQCLHSLVATHDFVCLGEVDSKVINQIRNELSDDDRVTVVDFSSNKETRNVFNIAVIFDKYKFEINQSRHIIRYINDANYKIALHCNITHRTGDVFDFFIVHWTSRNRLPDDASVRTHFGDRLRASIDEVAKVGSGNIIALGDFNDEPFNASIMNYLRGCRDASHAAGSDGILYNPFWKSISCSIGYDRFKANYEPTGSYLYKRDKLHKWRVFDQMLFSKQFIGQGPWDLIEEETFVLRYPELMSRMAHSDSKLDHLPITAALVRK